MLECLCLEHQGCFDEIWRSAWVLQGSAWRQVLRCLSRAGSIWSKGGGKLRFWSVWRERAWQTGWNIRGKHARGTAGYKRGLGRGPQIQLWTPSSPRRAILHVWNPPKDCPIMTYLVVHNLLAHVAVIAHIHFLRRFCRCRESRWTLSPRKTKQQPTLWSHRLALNGKCPCLWLLGAGIADMHYHR